MKINKKSKKSAAASSNKSNTADAGSRADRLKGDMHIQVKDSFSPERTYLPDNDSNYWHDFKIDIIRYISENVDPLATFSLIRYREADWSSMYRYIPIDVPRILKSKRRCVPDTGHSMSRIVTVARHAPDGADYDFYLAPEIVSLVWSTHSVLSDASHPVWEVGDGSVTALIDAFIDAPALLRKEAAREAKLARSKAWRGTKDDRARVLDEVRVQIPIKKSVFGTGQGEELVQRALLKPMQHIKFWRRDPDTLSREDVIDDRWDNAFRHGLDRPQRVKI